MWFQAGQWQHFRHGGFSQLIPEYQGTFGGRTTPQAAAESLQQWPDCPPVVTVLEMHLTARGFAVYIRAGILSVSGRGNEKILRFHMPLMSEAWAGQDFLYKLDKEAYEIRIL